MAGVIKIAKYYYFSWVGALPTLRCTYLFLFYRIITPARFKVATEKTYAFTIYNHYLGASVQLHFAVFPFWRKQYATRSQLNIKNWQRSGLFIIHLLGGAWSLMLLRLVVSVLLHFVSKYEFSWMLLQLVNTVLFWTPYDRKWTCLLGRLPEVLSKSRDFSHFWKDFSHF